MLGVLGGLGEVAVRPLGLLADEIPAQSAVLEDVGHRPWALPERPWLMGQTWYDLLFAHWPVDAGVVRELVPEQLEVDAREDVAWVGVTPFVLGGLRFRGSPPLPWLSRFPELNVRSYVRHADRPGIYFFSLDAARLGAVLAARAGYRLPYFHADMSAKPTDGAIAYRSRRKDERSVELRVTYEPAGARLPIEDGSLERWLTERYCVYVVDDRGRVLRGDIHHPPWPLQPATANFERNTMGSPLGLALDADPLLHYSPRQDTLIWSLEPS